MQLRKEELKKKAKVEAKVGKVTDELIISAFRVTENHMLEAVNILEVERNTKIWDTLQSDYQTIMDLQMMGKMQMKITMKFSLFKWVVTKVPKSM